MFPGDKEASYLRARLKKLKRKQIAQIIILLLAGVFIAVSMTSAKVKTLTKVKRGGITNPYLARNAVDSDKIKNKSVKNADLANNSVTSGKISDGEVSNADLANDAVDTSKILNNSVTSEKIADGQVSSGDLAASSVNSSKISDGSITAEDIKDGTITAAKMAAGVLLTGETGPQGPAGEGGVWGSITGTLSSQTDLQDALNDKANKVEITIGDEGYGSTFAEAITAISSTPATLIVPSGTQEGGGVTVPANVTLKILQGALLHEADGTTLTINGSLEVGLYQVFSWSGSGRVAFSSGAVKEVLTQWFGAKGDGSNDDTAALNAAEEATVSGGVIHLLPGSYKTSGWLVTKTISIFSDTPGAYGSSNVTTIKAAGAQSYVLKFEGVYDGNTGDASGMLHPFLRNINVDGDNKAISDAAFIMESCNFARVENCSFQNSNGHGVRLRTNWEIRFTDFWLNNCGTIDTGSAFFIDGPSPFDAAYGTNNLRIIGGTWSSNRGRWIDASSLSNLDATWIEGNKFELDNATTPNTANTDVVHLGAASRTMILDNTFAGFGESTDKYANLIYINGVPSPGNPGGPGNLVRGNRAYGYGANATFPSGNGPINGLYLDSDAPPTTEEDNTYSTNDADHTCANVNVSKYPQNINRAWATFSTSLFPLDPLPDRELPGFLSIHKVQRGTLALDFVADEKAVNNSQTVLKVDSTDGSYNIICWNLDLSRYVGNDPLTNLTVKIRMRLDSSAGGGDTDTVDAYLSKDPWPGSDATVDSLDWKWYSFVIPMSGITDANHLLDVTLTAKDKALYVDGFEFSAN
jgi:hypothetical protein